MPASSHKRQASYPADIPLLLLCASLGANVFPCGIYFCSKWGFNWKSKKYATRVESINVFCPLVSFFGVHTSATPQYSTSKKMSLRFVHLRAFPTWHTFLLFDFTNFYFLRNAKRYAKWVECSNVFLNV